ncbi:MAG: class I SAM-dependent methyltransferase [Polyangiaceae bacterium]|jgi:ubiquinone/menaquinone biosynthesis C-methylase UbiE
MTASAPTFDPAAFKRAAREQWQQHAEAWDRWAPTLESWLRPVTEALIELAGVREGASVLDVAAGAGEPTVSIAKVVGPQGSVLATDISSAILGFAAKRALREGVANVTTRIMDGEALELNDLSFDCAVSRLGVVYFPDRVRALGEVHRVLRVDGRVAIAGITSPAANPFSAVATRVLTERASLPPPPTGRPGPFSLGEPTAMREALEAAGFVDVETRIVDVPLEMPSARDCARLQREAFAGMDLMIARLPEAERDAAWEEVADALSEFERDGAFCSPTQLIVGSGVRR